MASYRDQGTAEKLKFASLHGKNITLSKCGTKAMWKKNFQSGICVTNRTIEDKETVYLNYEGSGHFLLGLVDHFPNIDSFPDTDATEWLDSAHWEYFRFRKSENVMTIFRSDNQFDLTWNIAGSIKSRELVSEHGRVFIFICVYFGDLEIFLKTDSPFTMVFDNRCGSNIRLSHQQQRVTLHHYNPYALCCIKEPLFPERQIQIVLSPLEDANWLHSNIFLSNVSPQDIGLSNLQSITDKAEISASFVPFGSMIEEESTVKIALLKSGEITSNINLNCRNDIPSEIDMSKPIFVYIEVFRMEAFLGSLSSKEKGDLCYSLSTTIAPRSLPSGHSYETFPMCYPELPSLSLINTMQIVNISDSSSTDEGSECKSETEAKTIADYVYIRENGPDNDRDILSEENLPNEETPRKHVYDRTHDTISVYEEVSEDVYTRDWEFRDIYETLPRRNKNAVYSSKNGPNNNKDMLPSESIPNEETSRKHVYERTQDTISVYDEVSEDENSIDWEFWDEDVSIIDFESKPLPSLDIQESFLSRLKDMQVVNMSDSSSSDEGNACNHLTEVKTIAYSDYLRESAAENLQYEETSRKHFDDRTQETIPKCEENFWNRQDLYEAQSRNRHFEDTKPKTIRFGYGDKDNLPKGPILLRADYFHENIFPTERDSPVPIFTPSNSSRVPSVPVRSGLRSPPVPLSRDTLEESSYVPPVPPRNRSRLPPVPFRNTSRVVPVSNRVRSRKPIPSPRNDPRVPSPSTTP